MGIFIFIFTMLARAYAPIGRCTHVSLRVTRLRSNWGWNRTRSLVFYEPRTSLIRNVIESSTRHQTFSCLGRSGKYLRRYWSFIHYDKLIIQ